ncbi:MAG: DUF6089 family protein [Bacteroidales bacterium]|jgi:hypothetical protein
MKKLLCLILLALHFQSFFGQRNADYGVLAGVTSYIGDINPGRLLYDPLPAAGVFYRYNLHPRQSIRFDVLAGGVRASDLDFKNAFQQARAASFSGEVGEVAAQFEFNFFNYSTLGRRWNYSPYIAGGVGVAVVNTTSFAVIPVIPFSFGFKVNIYKNLGLEVEYSFRKTFYDNFDGLKDFIDPADHGWLHDNDWYTFTGVALTWKMYNRLAGCPAYEDVDSRRKK